MSLATTLRFEMNTSGKSSLKQAFERQKERIQKDEMMADRENVVRLELKTNQRAQWNENLEQSSWKKRIREDDRKISEELRQAHKASIAVRKVALQRQLEQEHDIYEKELYKLGKTFFTQRV
ncbi:uncharacterized protein LOC117335054 [Pecten maximus]|uniref:uncharacterized protein LOC117335054 n=1 Tax=Pecten maximus TaxID=6579 RepID=UPI0014584234|nr:uncharacterized protein LOC117335054 [Pecten maximus]